MVYITMLSADRLTYVASDAWTISEQWLEKDLEVSGRGWKLPGELRKITENSVITAGLRAEIWNWDLPNTKQVCQPL
jgi:hypothetical protein